MFAQLRPLDLDYQRGVYVVDLEYIHVAEASANDQFDIKRSLIAYYQGACFLSSTPNTGTHLHGMHYCFVGRCLHLIIVDVF